MKHPQEVVDLVAGISERRPNGSATIVEPSDENGDWLVDFVHRDERMSICWHPSTGYTEQQAGGILDADMESVWIIHPGLGSVLAALETRIAPVQQMVP